MKPMYTTAAGLLLHAAGATARSAMESARGAAMGRLRSLRLGLGERFFLEPCGMANDFSDALKSARWWRRMSDD